MVDIDWVDIIIGGNMRLEKKVEEVGIFLYEYYVDENGKKQGILKKYNLDKTLCEELEYRDDYLNGKVLKYREGRVCLECNYILNRLDGVMTEYYESGKIKSISNYVAGKLQGKKEIYFENGKLATVTNYLEDKLNGEKKKYYESGELEFEGQYEKNNMVGIWKWYDREGNLLKTKEYM